MNLIVEKKDVPKELVRLLENREPYKYNLKINKKFHRSMSPNFWTTIIIYYNKVEFVELKDDEIYILEEIDGEGTSV